MNPIRKRLGLFWKGSRPSLADLDRLSDAITTILVLLVLILAYGIVQAHDDAVEAMIEEGRTAKQFADFLNGGVLVDEAGKWAAKIEVLAEVGGVR